MTVRLRWGAVTDTGRVRDANEDAILVADPLFVVADGMGGHAAGEVASNVAVATLRQAFDDEHPPTTEGIVEAVRQANRDIVRQSLDEPELRGMGTTVTGVALDRHRRRPSSSWCSTSATPAPTSCTTASCTQVTSDHSYVQELVDRGRDHPGRGPHPPQPQHRHPGPRHRGGRRGRHVGAVGRRRRPLPRLQRRAVQRARRRRDPRRADRPRPTPRRPPTSSTRRANEAGGRDNISVIVVDVTCDDDDRSAERDGRRPPHVGGWLARPTDGRRSTRRAVPGADEPARAASRPPPPAKRSRKPRVGTVLIVVAVIAVLGVGLRRHHLVRPGRLLRRLRR